MKSIAKKKKKKKQTKCLGEADNRHTNMCDDQRVSPDAMMRKASVTG